MIRIWNNYNMAYFNEKSGEIVLDNEEKVMFKEIQVNIASNRTPVSTNIMKSILKGIDSNKHSLNRS